MNSIKHICILRLSALGDVSNCLSAVRAIQSKLPDSKISWIIGKAEYELIKDIKNINFVVIDKSKLFSEWHNIKRHFVKDKVDVMLHMQASLRASIIRTAIKANRIIGFDKERSKDYQNLFCNEVIPVNPRAHVLETFMDFARVLKADTKTPNWNLPLEKMQKEASEIIRKLPDKYVVISPCSSKPIRNWMTKGYGEISDYIFDKYQLPVVITSGKSDIEFVDNIENTAQNKLFNLGGKTSIRQMVAILAEAQFIIAPDSGPAHIGSAVATPVIGLYANTNPKRARSYLYPQYVVNKYPLALKTYMQKEVDEVKFGTRVHHLKVMELIKIKDVQAVVDKLMSQIR